MTDSSEFSPEQAADPGTSMQDMARIAAERPDLWASLAANPSLYPDLREWLGQVDDPAVKEALSASAQRAAERVPAGDEPAEAPAAEEAPADDAPVAEVEDVKADDGAEADSAQEAPTAPRLVTSWVRMSLVVMNRPPISEQSSSRAAEPSHGRS